MTKEQVRAAEIASYHQRFDARTKAFLATVKGKDTSRAEKFCLNPHTELDLGSCSDELIKLGAPRATDRMQIHLPNK